MEVTVKSKIFGKPGWTDKKLKLPDFCAPYFEKYTIEIVEYHRFNCMGIFFQTKEDPKTDIWTHTVRHPGVAGNIVLGFKAAFEELERFINSKNEGNADDEYAKTFSLCGLS